jgi:hypothetical protein
MKGTAYLAVLLVSTVLVDARYAEAGQVPGAASDPDVPISHRDRVYAASSSPTQSRSPIPSTTSCSA